ncbi:DUF5060 domain-containing protein [Caulobacter sp. RHG1]|uniref:DUF5060 domain-containing protein n=1 Tax=Caulobacter sp. (strain RHG1) TaxID=2545762 RepID=UPI001F5079E2|nr:DUF5060 domain-containing protein [Caulobacter sp. RHG1]NQE63048.1 hypothetical protein [Caulobacter sp. RHG1]
MARRPHQPGLDLTRRAATGLGLAMMASPSLAAGASVPRWGVHEIVLDGPAIGNPFVDVSLSAAFTDGQQTLNIAGFYDGAGVYRVRFSPPTEGTWRWRTRSNAPALNGKAGTVMATAPRPGDHGPVKVAGGYHFAHADGTPFRQIGTTAYAWAQQSDALCDQTLETLAASPFNKMRMCVFPNVAGEPIHAFAQTADGAWDFDRFNPAYFRRFEDRVRRLGALGIQADLILFHPYDEKTGFHAMTPARDDRYVRYLVARMAAFSNVWWSLANEWDLVKAKTEADFDRMGRLIQVQDPYDRLRSIHNWRDNFDNSRPWITHSSIQNGSAALDDARAEIYRSVWKKPVVFDEVRYEGDLEKRWGDLRPEDLVQRFWHCLVAGTYVGHGEVYDTRKTNAPGTWTARGGKLWGQSAPRLAFLKTVMEQGPTPGLDPIDRTWDQHLGGQPGTYYLRYFGDSAPGEWAVALPKDELEGGERFRLDVLDTWAMTVTSAPRPYVMAKRDAYFFHDPQQPVVSLPGRPWMAVRLVRLNTESAA